MKKICTLAAGLLLLAAACTPKKAPDQPSADKRLDFSIEPGLRVGLITAGTTSREAVLAAYGDLAKTDSIYLVEGMMDEGVVLFPNAPRRTAYIYWDNSLDPKRPAFIRMNGDSTGASDWKTTSGLTIGSTLADVERLNGKPFRLSGFGWDYGGMVIDWQGGKLAASALHLTFSPMSGKTAERLFGEGEGFLSNEPDVVAADPRVVSMEFRILANDPLPACLESKVTALKGEGKMVVVRKMNVGGADHYWVSDGSAAFDGIEYIYDANCVEKCQVGGFRMPQECSKVYDQGQWEVVRE